MTPDEQINRAIGDLTGIPADPKHIPVDYVGLAAAQGQQAIVQTVERKDAERREQESHARIAMAVAEAMKPEVTVGAVEPEPKVSPGVPLEPVTVPEPRPTIQAGIEAVGKAGRKAVFSEVPFEAEDLPPGYETYESPKGGFYAAPKADIEEVVYRDSLDERHALLGYPAPKPEESDGTTVTVKDSRGRTVQDVLVDAFGTDVYDMTIKQAEELSKELGGYVEVKDAESVLKERTDGPTVDAETFASFATVEGNRAKAYKDSQGLTTVGVGFNMEQEGAKQMWEAAGVDQDFEAVKAGKAELSRRNTERLLGLTIGRSEAKARARAEELGLDWNALPEWHKAILTDIAFNTGSVKGWTKVFKHTNPLMVLREARRKEGGKHTMGMDNRVARIGLSLGLINSVETARKLGLTLTDLSPGEVAQLLKQRATMLAQAGKGGEA